MRTTLALAFLAFAGSALAQSGELWFSAGQNLISNGGLGTPQPIGGNSNDYALTDGFRFAFRFTFNQGSRFGHEVQYAYSRTQLKANLAGGAETGMAIHNGGYNFLVYGTPEGTRVRPFATGGVGFFNFVPPGASASYGGGSTKLGFSYGGGVKFKVTSMWAVRFDLRQYASPKPNFGLALTQGWIRQTEVSGGVGVVF